MNKILLKNKPFLFILFTAFLSILGIGLIIPVVPFIVQKYVGASHPDIIAWYVGLLTSLYAFCQFFAAPVLGALSDTFGRRPILLFCLFGSVIGYVLFGIGGSLWILFLGRIIDGLTGGDISTAMAYVADVTQPQERGKYYGVVGAVMGFGFMLGPSVGGLVAHLSLSAPLYLAAGLSFVSMLYGYFVLPESLNKQHRSINFSFHHLNPFSQMHYILHRKTLRSLMLIGAFYYFAFAQMSGITSVFFKDVLHWNPGTIGFYFLLLGIGDMVTQGYVSGKLIAKFGAIKILLAGFLITAIAFSINAILPLFPFALYAYIYVVIYALGSGLFEPGFDGIISQSASPQEQGRVQGASQSMQSITRIAGPITAALLYQFNPGFPWISCVIFSLIGAWFLFKENKRNFSYQ